MATNINAIKGKPRAVGNRVLVSDMHFGEQTTDSGIIVANDDGKERGIYPRWAKVYSKGPRNTDPYEVGHWVLIEPGRWTRGMSIDDGEGEKTLRMAETESILAWSEDKPEGLQIGNTTDHGSSIDIKPENFMRH